MRVDAHEVMKIHVTNDIDVTVGGKKLGRIKD